MVSVVPIKFCFCSYSLTWQKSLCCWRNIGSITAHIFASDRLTFDLGGAAVLKKHLFIVFSNPLCLKTLAIVALGHKESTGCQSAPCVDNGTCMNIPPPDNYICTCVAPYYAGTVNRGTIFHPNAPPQNIHFERFKKIYSLQKLQKGHCIFLRKITIFAVYWPFLWAEMNGFLSGNLVWIFYQQWHWQGNTSQGQIQGFCWGGRSVIHYVYATLPCLHSRWRRLSGYQHPSCVVRDDFLSTWESVYTVQSRNWVPLQDAHVRRQKSPTEFKRNCQNLCLQWHSISALDCINWLPGG